MARPPDTTDEAYADANLFIAFLAGREHPLHARAVEILTRMDRGGLRLIVSAVVVAEIIWSARGALGRSRSDMAGILLDVLESDGFEVLEGPVLRRALALLVAHPRRDLADAYLAARVLTLGPPGIASLDHDLDAMPGLMRLEA